MEIRIVGATKAAKQIMAAAESGAMAMGTELYRQAEAIMTASKTDYVPVDTGALRGTGYVAPPVFSGFPVSRAEVELGFGGPTAPYAVIVHEDLTKRHPVGQAKYLEIPLKARLAGMPAVLAARVNHAVRQAIQRLTNVERNVAAGRDVNWGMPLFRGAP